jgi:hypothetical protein
MQKTNLQREESKEDRECLNEARWIALMTMSYGELIVTVKHVNQRHADSSTIFLGSRVTKT